MVRLSLGATPWGIVGTGKPTVFTSTVKGQGGWSDIPGAAVVVHPTEVDVRLNVHVTGRQTTAGQGTACVRIAETGYVCSQTLGGVDAPVTVLGHQWVGPSDQTRWFRLQGSVYAQTAGVGWADHGLDSRLWADSNPLRGVTRTLTTGLVAAGEQELILWSPKAAGRRPVVFCHADNQWARHSADPVTGPAQMAFLDGLAAAGLPVICPDLAGRNWGSDKGVSRVEAARKVMVAKGCADDGLVLVLTSMGGVTGLNYTAKYPHLVHGLVCVAPVTALSVIRDSAFAATSGLRGVISASWNLTNTAPLPERADPANPSNVAKVAQSPAVVEGRAVFYHSAADTAVPSVMVTTYAGAVGAPAVLVSTTAPHSDLIFGEVPLADVLALIRLSA